jgi:hypothetical protein
MESPESPKLSVEALAQELNVLQQSENSGRGVSVVRSIIASLERGDISAAMKEASLDHDKIRNYPAIEELLRSQLFDGVPLHEWTPPIT